MASVRTCREYNPPISRSKAMTDDKYSEREDIEMLLRRIETIIVEGRLPRDLAGDLMSKSLHEFYDRLSTKLESLAAAARKKATE